MKAWILGGCTAGMAALMTGCTTPSWLEGTMFDSTPKPDPAVARVATTTQQMSMEFRQLAEQMAEIRRNQQEQDARLNRMEAQLSSGGRTQSEITALQRDIQLLRADRETLKKEITTDLAARIEKIAVRANAANTRPAQSGQSRTGYEHKVEKGQTLSEIARGYGKSIDSIMKANNIKDASALRVGQVLFIPD
ncbi:MAG: LysM peptidoglycan-binding domain-containing protein [Kiritimatiellaeota bacterium]|nr:LysM peptidoglycan-binding domain-containing protein [Kiritimatiellota bacterium]